MWRFVDLVYIYLRARREAPRTLPSDAYELVMSSEYYAIQVELLCGSLAFALLVAQAADQLAARHLDWWGAYAIVMMCWLPALALTMYDFWRWRTHLSQSTADSFVSVVGSRVWAGTNPIPKISAPEPHQRAAQDGTPPPAMNLEMRSPEGTDLPFTPSGLPASRLNGLAMENAAAQYSQFPSSPLPVLGRDRHNRQPLLFHSSEIDSTFGPASRPGSHLDGQDMRLDAYWHGHESHFDPPRPLASQVNCQNPLAAVYRPPTSRVGTHSVGGSLL
jgi:hypothetical protein